MRRIAALVDFIKPKFSTRMKRCSVRANGSYLLNFNHSYPLTLCKALKTAAGNKDTKFRKHIEEAKKDEWMGGCTWI